MQDRRNVGDIFMALGRLTQAEVDRALDHQRQHGGYFGEALLALGLVSRQELDWILATQFDIPYIVPDPAEIDLSAARLVTPQWAHAHTALPILQTQDSITVLVADPNRQAAALEQFRSTTGKRLDLAMASPGAVRRVVNEVFSRIREDGPGQERLMTVAEFWAEARTRGATGFGISARGMAVWGWFEVDGHRQRRPLDARWEQDLDRLLNPAVGTALADREMGEWRADLDDHGSVVPVDVACLRTRGGTELVVRPVSLVVAHGISIAPPQPELAAEVSRLVQSGGARFRVVGNPAALSTHVTPYLPGLLLGDCVRAVHVTDTDGDAPDGIVAVRLERDVEQRSRQLAGIRAFSFDVLTASMAGPATELAGLAPSLFLAGATDELGERRAGIDWELRVAGTDSGRLDWSLHRVDS